MSSTTTRDQIGSEDINWYDGEDTFTRRNSTGGLITLTKVKKGYEFDAYEILGTDSLARALEIIGANKTILVLRPEGTWNVNNNTTIPSTISLKVVQGATLVVANTKTLTIEGEIEAGHYQIFSWVGTGKVDISSSPTTDCLFEWWGPDEGITNTVTAQLLKAYQSCGSQQNIIVGKGIWRLATSMTYVPAGGWGSLTEVWIPDLVGEDPIESIIYIDVGAGNDGIAIGGIVGGDTHWIQSGKIRNLNIVGPDNACRHALNLSCWNGFGGTENVNLIIGSTDFAVRLAQNENSIHDFSLGWWNGWLENESIPYGYMKDGIQYEAEPGGTGIGCGSYGRIRIKKSSSWAGTRALLAEDSGNLTVEEGIIENCFFGETAGHPFWDYVALATVPLYSGGVTRVAQTFTLAGTTVIRNCGFTLMMVGDSPRGPVVAKIYNTAAGAPTGAALYTSHTSLQASSINGGGAFAYVFDFLPQPSLAAGTYAVSVEYAGGDSSNYVSVRCDGDTPTDPGTAYTYSGAAWSAQASYDVRFAVNVNPAMEFNDCERVQIRPQHFEANWLDLKIDNCSEIQVDCISVGGSTIDIARSKNVEIRGVSESLYLKIDPVSTVTIGDMVYPVSVDAISDFGNVLYLGRQRDWFNNSPPNIKGNNFQNLMPNHLFDRWVTAAIPEGWSDNANTTWAKETSIVHQATNSAKLIVDADTTTNAVLPADVLKAVKGQHILFSSWLYFPAGQTWGNNKHRFQIFSTFPAWVASTAYQIGDAVYEDGNMFICVVPGTSGTAPNEPDWAGATAADYLDDNTCRWLKWYGFGQHLSGGVMDDSVSDAVWRRWHVNSFVPRNATAAQVTFYVKAQSPANNTTVYVAEPSLNLGFIPGRSIQPAPNETPTFMQVGGNRLYLGQTLIPSDGSSPLKDQYAIVGDIAFNAGVTTSSSMGWMCTTAGINGTSSVWTVMPAINVT